MRGFHRFFEKQNPLLSAFGTLLAITAPHVGCFFKDLHEGQIQAFYSV